MADILDYIDKMQIMYGDKEPSSMVPEPRNMFANGQTLFQKLNLIFQIINMEFLFTTNQEKPEALIKIIQKLLDL